MIAERKKNIHTTEEERRKSGTKMTRTNRLFEDLFTYRIEYKAKKSWRMPKIPNRVGEKNYEL
jgi:hypothetical protein